MPGRQRYSILQIVNEAFAANRIGTTAQHLAGLAARPETDAFDLLQALGAFGLPDQAALDAYRASLAIPRLSHGVLTAAFKHAITHTVPLSFAIVGGDAEGVQVYSSPKLLSLVLTRVD